MVANGSQTNSFVTDAACFSPMDARRDCERGVSRASQNHINRSFLQNVVSGIPALMLGLGTRMGDPYVYVSFFWPRVSPGLEADIDDPPLFGGGETGESRCRRKPEASNSGLLSTNSVLLYDNYRDRLFWAHNYGLLSINPVLLYGIVTCHSGLLGSAGSPPLCS